MTISCPHCKGTGPFAIELSAYKLSEVVGLYMDQMGIIDPRMTKRYHDLVSPGDILLCPDCSAEFQLGADSTEYLIAEGKALSA